jgi:hypothetical protein
MQISQFLDGHIDESSITIHLQSDLVDTQYSCCNSLLLVRDLTKWTAGVILRRDFAMSGALHSYCGTPLRQRS